MEFYIDYDEHPDLGGQQGTFPLNEKDININLFDFLIGKSIKSMRFNTNQEDRIGLPGRVLIIEVEDV